MLRSIKLSLRTRELDCFDYARSSNPPILHRKESFLPPGHALVARFARLTWQEQNYGLLDETATIGTRAGWEQRLKEWDSRFAGIDEYGGGRKRAKSADYRGDVTWLRDTQPLGACLHVSECGGRSRSEAVRGMPDVPIALPATGPRRGRAHRRSLGWAVGLVSPASFCIQGLGRVCSGLGSFPLILGSERVRIWVIGRF